MNEIAVMARSNFNLRPMPIKGKQRSCRLCEKCASPVHQIGRANGFRRDSAPPLKSAIDEQRDSGGGGSLREKTGKAKRDGDKNEIIDFFMSVGYGGTKTKC